MRSAGGENFSFSFSKTDFENAKNNTNIGGQDEQKGSINHNGSFSEDDEFIDGGV